MLPTGQPQYVEIFVTHVVEDGPLLKIYGQLDRTAAIFVEKLILQYIEPFERGVGSVFPGTLMVDSLCCAKYGGDGSYYRAKILDISSIQQGFVRVNFIDYGNSDIVNISNIRSLNGMQNSPLCSVHSQATEFILAGIVPPLGVAWDESSVEFIKEKLCYAEFRCAIVAQFSGRKLIKLYYNDVDFAEILVQKNLALRISLQAQQNMLQNLHQYGSVPPFNYSVPPPAPVSYNNTTNANLLVKAAAITKQESGVISAPLLTIGSKHSIYVSYVEDGPYLFAIQLKSTENILQNMTKAFTQFMLKPFSQSPIPGSACVTVLSQSKVLCRAVVTNLIENECVVYCVDFGNTETVPFSQIYEVPPQFLNTKSLAMRFSLAGIQNANFNDAAKRIFQELVMGETLLLEVVEPEGPPLKQYGHIYLNGENMVNVLKEKMRSLEKPKSYPPLPAIQPGRIVNVTVSYVESVNEFYVQYDANSKGLESIMQTMAHYCSTSAKSLRLDELFIGMPVCALFSADQQWYRAKVVSATADQVTVFHVDYGSNDAVSLGWLRHMDPNLLQCQAQAVQCALVGFQDYPGSLEDISNRLEELTLERKLTMKITNYLQNGRLLVELHDTTVAPVQNIAEQIKKPAQIPYDQTIDEWIDPAASGEPAVVPLHSAPFGGRDKSKYEDGSGEGWKSDSKRSGGWGESRDNKKWGNREDRGRGDKKWNRDEQGGGEKWGKEGNSNWENREGRGQSSDNRGSNDRNWNSRGDKEESGSWRNREDNRRGFNKDGNDWKNKDNKKGYNKDENDWQEQDNNTQVGSNRDSERKDRDNKRGFNKDDNWKDNKRGLNKDDDWKDKENKRGFNRGGDDWKEKDNKRGFNREGGDWKDREGGRQGFRDSDNRRGFNRDGGDRNWKKNEDGNHEGKKWWCHDDRSEPEKKWNDRQDGDQNWGGREKRSTSGGDFKKWNDGDRKGDFGGDSVKAAGENEWGVDDSVTSAPMTTVDAWDTSDAMSRRHTGAGGFVKQPYPETVVSLGSKHNVTLVSAEDPTNFVLQIDEKIPDITKIMEDIATMYESGGNIMLESNQIVSSPCIARYPEDETWYRAIITKTPVNGTTEVHFVDYGNRMDVTSTDIKEIVPKFKNVSPFGIPCSLNAVQVPVIEWTQEQIDEFLNLADGKKLEAHFIKKTGPVFELILTDTEDASCTINEKFGASKESLDSAVHSTSSKPFQAKKISNFQPQSKPLAADVEYASPEDTYHIAEIEASTSEAVTVGWFINPDQFYCLRNSSKDVFTSMVNDIQLAYKKRPSCKDTLIAGQPIIARFPADQVLYRAEVVEVKGLNYQVQYVDYGNMELLAPRHIWQMEKRFLSLPKQGVLCSLRGVQPKDSEWPKDNPEFEKYFGGENIECTFHGITNGKYSVSLSSNGQDVANELVSCGLATEKTDEKVKPLEPLALRLLKGQQVSAHVTFIENTSKFFVHLDPVTAKNIQEKIEKHMESAKSVAPPSDLVEHQMCLATPDGTEWYRGKIIDIPSEDKVCFHFVDFGDSHTIPLDQVRVLPDSLLGYRHQATECFVCGSEGCEENNDDTIEETFKLEVEVNDVIISIEDVRNDRLAVHLFDVEGQRLELLKTVDTTSPVDVEPLCPMPVLTNTEPMWVSHIDGVNAIWLQKESAADILSGLLELLFSFYEEEAKGVDLGDPFEGQLSAAKSQDGSWYRARVKGVSEDNVTVVYIDYGNSEMLTKSDIKELDPSFCRIHALAVCASLPVNTEDSDGCVRELGNVTAETLFDVSFARKETDWWVHLENNDMNLVDHLVSAGLVSEIETSMFQSESVSIPDVEKLDVYISHYELPSNFWVQKDSNFVDILDLQLYLQLVGGNQAVITNHTVGALCLAQFSDDQWYRAKIIENYEQSVKVFFVDYGNRYELDAKLLRKLPIKFFRWPHFAVQCCLSDASFLSNEELLRKCSVVMSETENVFQLKKVGDGDPLPVVIFVGDKDLETVVNETEIPCEEEEAIKVMEIKKVDSVPVFVSHICSPAKFWIQKESISSELEKLADTLIEAVNFQPVGNAEVGTICAALFDDDEQWYRAQVLECCDDNYHVLFIDYGNSSFVSELRQLPEELVKIPPIAQCCRLQFPAGTESWSVDADKKFVDLSGEGTVIFKMIVCSNEECLEVKLLYDGKNVSDIITESALSCALPANDNKTDEKETVVIISHVNTLCDFWVQLESESSKLDSIADQLLEAESFESLETASNDTVCAAQFPEDELWYRAKITSFEDQNVNVTFIDYGNSAQVTEIRRLPESLASIPALAAHCCLPLPKNCERWPEKVEEEFFNIFGDGTNTYVLTTLQDGDPSIVSLQLNNVKVEDMLTKCMGLNTEKLISDDVSSSSTDVEILAEAEVMMDPNEAAEELLGLTASKLEHLETVMNGSSVLDSEQSHCIQEEKIQNEEISLEEKNSESKISREQDELEKLNLEEQPLQLEGGAATVQSSKQIDVELSPKHAIEHREQIIVDFKVELQMPSQVLPVNSNQDVSHPVGEDSPVRKLSYAERIVPGSISRGVSEDLEVEDVSKTEENYSVHRQVEEDMKSESNQSPDNEQLTSGKNEGVGTLASTNEVTGSETEDILCENFERTEDVNMLETFDNYDILKDTSKVYSESTPKSGSPTKIKDTDSQESDEVKALNRLESSSMSSTPESSNINTSSESQNSADISGSADDSSSCTIVDNEIDNTGCISVDESKSNNYELASLHKSEELYISSKSEVLPVNPIDDSHEVKSSGVVDLEKPSNENNEL